MPKKILLIIILIIIVIIGVYSAYIYFSNKISSDELISNWEIYSNEEYNYKVRYPIGWRYVDNQGEPNPVLLQWTYFLRNNPESSKEFDRIEIKVYNLSLEKYIESLESEAKINKWSIEEGGSTSVNGIPFIKIIMSRYNNGVRNYFVVFSKNKVYSIFYEAQNYLKETEEIFNQMLSTFRFSEK